LRAQCNLPDGPNYKRDAFVAGLKAAGYELCQKISNPEACDILVIWNRPASQEAEAKRFERAGARVVVAENGYLGKNWNGRKWFALAIGHHAGAGEWNDNGPSRWVSWGVQLQDWKPEGETLILAQRGIGEPGIASPRGWAQEVQQRIGGRIRKHPGINEPEVPLIDDLIGVGPVVTWHSAAAIQALILGHPVWYAFPRWLMAEACMSLNVWRSCILLNDLREPVLERMAWAMWESEEIRSGEAFRTLLS